MLMSHIFINPMHDWPICSQIRDGPVQCKLKSSKCVILSCNENISKSIPSNDYVLVVIIYIFIVKIRLYLHTRGTVASYEIPSFNKKTCAQVRSEGHGSPVLVASITCNANRFTGHIFHKRAALKQFQIRSRYQNKLEADIKTMGKWNKLLDSWLLWHYM